MKKYLIIASFLAHYFQIMELLLRKTKAFV